VAALIAMIPASTVRADDDPEDIEFPPGLLPIDLNGPNVKRSQSIPLGDTKYRASIGHWGRRKDAVDYSISVEKAVELGEVIGHSVCFEAKFKIADLPKDFSKKRIADVVTFDGTTVTFDLGVEKRQFKLPSEQNRRPVQNVAAPGMFAQLEFWLVTTCVISMISIAVVVAFAAVFMLRFYRRRAFSDEWELD
jgi:hypothetical protein